jgi:nucleotide-binding universal stress UspA family protein
MNPITITQGPARKIAVLTDFSPCSSSAVNHAVRLASYSNGRVFLIHAIEPWTYACLPDEAQMEQQLCDRAHWNMLREQEKLCGVRHEVIIQHGRPWDVLRRVVESEHIDMVVLGTIGMVSFHNDEVLGSTAEQVIRQSPCPVLTVGSEVAVKDSFPDFSQVLFSTDLAGSAETALGWAASFAERHRAHLALMHVVPAHRPAEPVEAESLKAPYQRRLVDMLHRPAKLNYSTDCLVDFAETPANAVVKAARELAADVIVMGSAHRNKAGVNAQVHSSLRILMQAPCPVLTVPEKDGIPIGKKPGPRESVFYLGQPEGSGRSAHGL